MDLTKFLCSVKFGGACVSHGYWYGPVTTNDNTTSAVVYTVASCTFPECNYSTPCPPQLLTTGSNSEDFVLLRHDPDDQCSAGRGGLLCSSCKSGFVFTFTAVNCVANSACQVWHPYIIIPISLVSQMVFAIVLMLVVRFKISLGSGFLYGPMLFLSVASNLPLTHYPQYSILNTLISVVSSIPLLNLEVFGLIPWCFFQSFDKIYNYSLRYLGPLTVVMVILMIAFVARRCPNALRRWQTSPLRAMCLLMILSFWSLADTSVNILTPKIITYSQNSSTYVVSLQPDMGYFSLPHLPVAIPALLVLVVLLSPLLVILLFFPLLSKVIDLYRIKPFLDEFHSCYKDSFRWYSAIYFSVWIITVIIRRFAVSMVIVQTMYFLLLTTQILIQPYQNKWLNMADILLLVTINFLLALVQSKTITATITYVFVHILVLGPMLCITVWFGCVLIIKFGVCNCCHKRRRRQPVTDEVSDVEDHSNVQVPRMKMFVKAVDDDDDDEDEREPLIRIVSYQ